MNQKGLDCGTQAVGVAEFDAGGAVEMLVEPPVADVLEAEHPGLAGAVGDGRAHLRVAVGGAGVVPVVALAGEEVAAQVVEIVGGGDAGEAVEVVGAVAPVGERPVDVDGDGVDVGGGPERVEVEIDIARAVGRLVAEVLRPVGGVGDLGGRAEHGLDVGGVNLSSGGAGVMLGMGCPAGGQTPRSSGGRFR